MSIHNKAQAGRLPLPDFDQTTPAERLGVFRKFDVVRTDGKSAPGEKHHGCEYFVLDIDHDPFARAALTAYADAAEAKHSVLAADMRYRYGLLSAHSVKRDLDPLEVDALMKECGACAGFGGKVDAATAFMTALDEFERRERGVPQAHMAAQLVSELRAALASQPAQADVSLINEGDMPAALQAARTVPTAQGPHEFETAEAQALQSAWVDGFEACRDSEFVGEEAMNDAFNRSRTLSECLDAEQAARTVRGDARDANRFREVLHHVGADHQCGGFRFTLYTLEPVRGSNIMQGAVCQHFIAAIDAALAAKEQG